MKKAQYLTRTEFNTLSANASERCRIVIRNFKFVIKFIIKRLTHYIPALLVGAALFSSCTKEPQGDPRFSCKINGEPWNPQDGDFSFGLTATYDYQPNINRNVFNILAAQHDHPKYIEIGLTFVNPSEGNYRPQHRSSFAILTSNLESYFLDTLHPYKIQILTFDKINRKCQGVFEGYYKNRFDSLSVLLITEGKFNVKF